MILADGTMSLNDQMIRAIEIDAPGSYFGNPSAHLGATVGLSYGVALAHRNYVDVVDRGSYKVGRMSESKRPVVCTLGDGEAAMGNIASALWTCSHYGLGVLYVVLNNACWAAELSPFGRIPNGWVKESGDYEFLDLDNPRFDFAKIAQGVNVRSERITSVERLDAALDEANRRVRASEPVLLDLWMDKPTGPNASVVP